MKNIKNWNNFVHENTSVDEIRTFVIPYLKHEHNITVEKSINPEYNWFISAPSEELPNDIDDMSTKDQQEYGTHFSTDEELLNYAKELGYLTDDDVFGSY